MEDLPEIGAIWRGETRRALKSGRVLVLLILFVLFVGLALTIVGGINHQLNSKFDQQVLMAGGNVDEARAAAKEQLTPRFNLLGVACFALMAIVLFLVSLRK